MWGAVGSGNQVDDCLLSSMAGDVGQEWVGHCFPLQLKACNLHWCMLYTYMGVWMFLPWWYTGHPPVRLIMSLYFCCMIKGAGNITLMWANFTSRPMRRPLASWLSLTEQWNILSWMKLIGTSIVILVALEKHAMKVLQTSYTNITYIYIYVFIINMIMYCH